MGKVVKSMESGVAQKNRKIYFELLVTVGLLAIPSFLQALYAFQYGRGNLFNPQHADWYFALMIVHELLLIGLLAHIVRLHGESLATFTCPISKREIFYGAGLAVTGLAILWITIYQLYYWFPDLFSGSIRPRNVEFMQVKFSLFYFLAIIVNPFCEELFMRGFFQTRLKQAGWSAIPIIILSVLFQAGYHIYQGVAYCLAIGLCFLLWSIFYQKTMRLWPVIIAHLMVDILAMLGQAR